MRVSLEGCLGDWGGGVEEGSAVMGGDGLLFGYLFDGWMLLLL